MAEGVTGRTFELREFTLHDGPGARTTVFFKGCPLRCAWCHNPEGQDPSVEMMKRRSDGETTVCGTDWTPYALAEALLTNADFLSMAGGGNTFSGGEPLMQAPFLLELIPLLRRGWHSRLGPDAAPLHLALETSGYSPSRDYRRVAESVDLVYQDLKHPNPVSHKYWTGVDPAPIRENLAWLKAGGKPFIARIPLVPGVNDAPDELEAAARLLDGAKGLIRVELLPYNRAAGAKYPLLGRAWEPAFNETLTPHADVTPFTARGIACVVL